MKQIYIACYLFFFLLFLGLLLVLSPNGRTFTFTLLLIVTGIIWLSTYHFWRQVKKSKITENAHDQYAVWKEHIRKLGRPAIFLYVILIALCFLSLYSRIITLILLAIFSGMMLLPVKFISMIVPVARETKYYQIKDPEKKHIWLKKNHRGPFKIPDENYWNLLSCADSERGNYSAALEANNNFLAALKNKYNDHNCHPFRNGLLLFQNNRCNFLIQLNRFEELESELVRLNQYLAENPQPLVRSMYDFYCAWLAIYKKDLSAAREFLEAYKKDEQQSQSPLHIKLLEAGILSLEGQTEAARIMLQTALDTDPNMQRPLRDTFEQSIRLL